MLVFTSSEMCTFYRLQALKTAGQILLDRHHRGRVDEFTHVRRSAEDRYLSKSDDPWTLDRHVQVSVKPYHQKELPACVQQP